MVHYLIEFRFHGYAKKYAKQLIHEVAKKFRVKGVTRNRAVPHITLFGPFTIKQERKVVLEVVDIGREFSLVPFIVKDFNYFDKEHKVIYLDIDPSAELKELRRKLSQKLGKISDSQPWDDKKQFQFHSTIAFRDIDRKFSRIWEYIKDKEEPNIKQHLLRITIIKGKRILYEYDLILKKLLNRKQALSRYWLNKTIRNYKDYMAS
ncbi:MAG: 2'-5' RNA ligase family protein [Dehalococcoidales bacterium]|nr:2'-5' RNA ligase family protein [Dehalococcoidales bacterium]